MRNPDILFIESSPEVVQEKYSIIFLDNLENIAVYWQPRLLIRQLRIAWRRLTVCSIYSLKYFENQNSP